MAKVVIDTVLEDAATIAKVWTDNPNFGLGDIKLADFQAALAAAQAATKQAEEKRIELVALMDVRDDKVKALSDLITRARSGFRAIYGPDSPQYEQAGGTRRSERKKPVRKPKA